VHSSSYWQTFIVKLIVGGFLRYVAAKWRNSINYKNLSVFAEDDFDLMKISLDYYLGIFWGIFVCVVVRRNMVSEPWQHDAELVRVGEFFDLS